MQHLWGWVVGGGWWGVVPVLHFERLNAVILSRQEAARGGDL